MKILKIILITGVFLMFGCSKPVAVEIKDVCSMPVDSKVIIQGFISLPQQIETIQLTRGGRIEEVGLNLFLMTKADATGDSVKTIFWTSPKPEPNKIKPLSRGYTWNDLLVYTDDGGSIGAGKIVKVTGTTQQTEKGGCAVNVTKIENP